MTDWYLGTMGFSFQDWAGSFYPSNLRPNKYLSFYSQFFNAVEIDTTFYGTPKKKTLNRWYDMTPKNFIFCLKLPRQITHERKLVEAQSSLSEFLKNVSLLGEKLGVILVQLPPEFSYEYFHVFSTFIKMLPKNFRFAIEFRNQTWENPATRNLFQEKHICWASVDYTIMTKYILKTTDYLYIRWIGYHGQFEKKDRIQKNTNRILEVWLEKIQENLNETKQIYGFFNNDFAGHSPASCNQFKTLIGLPVKTPKIPRQTTLF